MVNSYMHTQESRFAEVDEIIKETEKIDLKSDFYVGGVPVISDGETVYVDNKDSNSMIIADPGSGKTRRVAIPLVMSCASGRSMVINDPKAEIIRSTKDYLLKKGYTIRIINIRNPRYGDAYNPLFYGAKLYASGKKDMAKEEFTQLAETLYSQVHSEKDPFWEIMAINIFTGFALLACNVVKTQEVTIPLIYRLFNEGEEKIGRVTVLKEYLKRCNDPVINESLTGYVNAATETRASILSVFSSVLSRLVINESINDLISNNTFDPQELIDNKTALFIIPRDEVGVYNTLVTAIIDQIYTRLLFEAERTNGVLQRKCEFIIDEFSNLTPLHFMDNKISESRSRGIRWHLFVQSYDQIVHRYKELAAVIISCCQNTFYMHTPENKILEMISERCGSYVSEYTHERKRLLNTSTLQHFDKDSGQVLILLNRCYPFVTNLPDVSVYLDKNGFGITDTYRGRSRKKFKQSTFSLKNYVEKQREVEMEKLIGDSSMNIEPHSTFINDFEPAIERPSVDSIIAKIDKEIERLERKIEDEKEVPKDKIDDNQESDFELYDEYKTVDAFLSQFKGAQVYDEKQFHEYFNKLDVNRDNAEELYECIDKYSYKEVYMQLLNRFNGYLSSKELEYVKKKYAERLEAELNTN